MKISILKLPRPSQDEWLKCLDRCSLIVTALCSGLHPLVSSIDQLRPPNTLTKVKGKAEAKQLRSLTQAFGENRKWQSSFRWVQEAEGAWGWESGVGAPVVARLLTQCGVCQSAEWCNSGIETSELAFFPFSVPPHTTSFSQWETF